MFVNQIVKTIKQTLLLYFLILEGGTCTLVDRMCPDELVHSHWMQLPLAVQSGVCLLKQFQIPAGAKPNYVMAALLHIETIRRACRVSQ